MPDARGDQKTLLFGQATVTAWAVAWWGRCEEEVGGWFGLDVRERGQVPSAAATAGQLCREVGEGSYSPRTRLRRCLAVPPAHTRTTGAKRSSLTPNTPPSGDAPNPNTETSKPVFPNGRRGSFGPSEAAIARTAW